MSKETNAFEELTAFLEDGEVVESIVFGGWRGNTPYNDEPYEEGYGETDPPLIPYDKRAVVLSFEEAIPFMKAWQFDGGYGGANTFATTIWTNQRVIIVGVYDGSTWLEGIPRNPCPDWPRLCGGH